MNPEAIRLQDWIGIYGKWVHFQLQPPKESHEVKMVSMDGMPWQGPVHASADTVISGDALVVGLQRDGLTSDPEAIVEPDFTGGRFTVTLQLPTAGGMLFPRKSSDGGED